MLTLRMHSSRTSTRCRRTTPHTTSSSQRAPTAALPLQMSEPDSARNTPRRSRSAADEGLNESQYGRSTLSLWERVGGGSQDSTRPAPLTRRLTLRLSRRPLPEGEEPCPADEPPVIVARIVIPYWEAISADSLPISAFCRGGGNETHCCLHF